MAPRLVVVGAGLAGLSTAIHARMSGYEVDVFEHGDRPGGVCTSWPNGAYTVDACIHWLMGSGPNGTFRPLYEEVGALEGVRLLPLRTFARAVDASGNLLDFDADIETLPARVADISPEDRPFFEEIAEAISAFADFRMDAADAPELRGVFASLSSAWSMRHHLGLLMRYGRSMGELAERIEHPFLRRAFRELFLPEMPASFLLVTLAELASGNLSRIEGGSQRLSDAVARRLDDLGGTVRYGADVEEILVDDDAAVGVRLTDGSVHRGDRVVSAAPGYTTIFRMLGGRYTDRATRDRYVTWPTFHPVALVNFGVARAWPDLPPVLHVQLPRPWNVVGHPVDRLLVRNFSDDPALAPAGHTVVQVMFETPFDLWHDLHHAPDRYRRLTDQVAAETLAQIAPWLPGLSASDVEVTDVATPYTFWRFARTWRGAFEGWLPTTETVRVHPSKKLPGLSGFLMAGQWVEPGGGVPSAVMSGRHAVQILCHDDRRPFHGG